MYLKYSITVTRPVGFQIYFQVNFADNLPGIAEAAAAA
jgi:hypothetical protein